MKFIAWVGLFLVFVVIGVTLREQRDDRWIAEGQDQGDAGALGYESKDKETMSSVIPFPIESAIVRDAASLSSFKPGQFFSLAKEGEGDSAGRFQIRVTESEEKIDVMKLRGVVEGGGQVVMTLSPNLTQIFLTTPSGAWHFTGDEFGGELIPSKSIGLDNDIRKPTLGERKTSDPKPPPSPADRG